MIIVTLYDLNIFLCHHKVHNPIEILLKRNIILRLKYCVYIFLVLNYHNSKIWLKYYFAKLLYNKLLCTIVMSINCNIAHASTFTKILLELHILLKLMIIRLFYFLG